LEYFPGTIYFLNPGLNRPELKPSRSFFQELTVALVI